MTHPTQPVPFSNGGLIAIDVGVAALVQALWALGIRTVDSCQDIGESLAAAFPPEPHLVAYADARRGLAQVGFQEVADAEMFLNAVVSAGRRGDALHARATNLTVLHAWQWSVLATDLAYVDALDDEDISAKDLVDPNVVAPDFVLGRPRVLFPAYDVDAITSRLHLVAQYD